MNNRNMVPIDHFKGAKTYSLDRGTQGYTGYWYERKLIVFITLLLATSPVKWFSLTSNPYKKFQPFDDIILEMIMEDGQCKFVFYQAKVKQRLDALGDDEFLQEFTIINNKKETNKLYLDEMFSTYNRSGAKLNPKELIGKKFKNGESELVIATNRAMGFTAIWEEVKEGSMFSNSHGKVYKMNDDFIKKEENFDRYVKYIQSQIDNKFKRNANEKGEAPKFNPSPDEFVKYNKFLQSIRLHTEQTEEHLKQASFSVMQSCFGIVEEDKLEEVFNTYSAIITNWCIAKEKYPLEKKICYNLFECAVCLTYGVLINKYDEAKYKTFKITKEDFNASFWDALVKISPKIWIKHLHYIIGQANKMLDNDIKKRKTIEDWNYKYLEQMLSIGRLENKTNLRYVVCCFLGNLPFIVKNSPIKITQRFKAIYLEDNAEKTKTMSPISHVLPETLTITRKNGQIIKVLTLIEKNGISISDFLFLTNNSNNIIQKKFIERRLRNGSVILNTLDLNNLPVLIILGGHDAGKTTLLKQLIHTNDSGRIILNLDVKELFNYCKKLKIEELDDIKGEDHIEEIAKICQFKDIMLKCLLKNNPSNIEVMLDGLEHSTLHREKIYKILDAIQKICPVVLAGNISLKSEIANVRLKSGTKLDSFAYELMPVSAENFLGLEKFRTFKNMNNYRKVLINIDPVFFGNPRRIEMIVKALLTKDKIDRAEICEEFFNVMKEIWCQKSHDFNLILLNYIYIATLTKYPHILTDDECKAFIEVKRNEANETDDKFGILVVIDGKICTCLYVTDYLVAHYRSHIYKERFNEGRLSAYDVQLKKFLDKQIGEGAEHESELAT